MRTAYLKFNPQSGLYRSYNGNCSYDPKRLEARSYGWWIMAKPLNDIMVLNSYRYSVTTDRHQRSTRDLFRSLGLTWVEVEAPQGLQDLQGSLDYYRSRVEALEAQILKPGSRKAKNAERRAEIEHLLETAQFVSDAMKAGTQ